METKIDISKTTLLLIDMQNDLIKSEDAYAGTTRMAAAKGLIPKTAAVLAAARKAGMPVIYACHVHRADRADVVTTINEFTKPGATSGGRDALVEGTYGGAIVDELKPLPDEHVILKRRSNSFYNSDLELMLRARGTDTLLIAGVITDGCVINTIRGARDRDLNVIVLSDCCATNEPEDDEYFIRRVFPRAGRVRTAADIVAALQ